MKWEETKWLDLLSYWKYSGELTDCCLSLNSRQMMQCTDLNKTQWLGKHNSPRIHSKGMVFSVSEMSII